MANSPLKITSALVTGGAGFIGSHLVAALVRSGCRVTVLDNLSSGCREDLAPFLGRITFLEGDIRDDRLLARASAGQEVVFHLAAVVSVPKTIEDPVASAAVNDIGTLNVLEAARRQQARRVVLSSSCAVYGNPDRQPIREDWPVRPISPYAAHKVSGENYAAIYNDLYGLETVCLRYFNVFGPGQTRSSAYAGVISIFMERAGRQKPPRIFGDGEQTRDFVCVADAVRANLLAAGRPGISGRIFNVGSGRKITINRLWREIGSLADNTRAPEYKPARKGDIRASVADISLAREKLGFQTKISLEKGLAETYRWYAQLDIASSENRKIDSFS